MQETWVRSLGWEDPLEEGMATHSGILAWRIPWIEKPGGLQAIRSQRVRHNWSDWHTHTCMHAHIRRTMFKTKRNVSYMQAWNLKCSVSEMFSGKSPVPWRAPINQRFSKDESLRVYTESLLNSKPWSHPWLYFYDEALMITGLSSLIPGTQLQCPKNSLFHTIEQPCVCSLLCIPVRL